MGCDFKIGRATGLVTLLVLAASLGGCASGDDDGTNYPEIGDIPEPFLYTDVPEPYPDGDVAACKAFTEADGDVDEAVATRRRECFCDTCLTLMRQCDALQGCQEIRQCQWKSNCGSAEACYLFPGAPCKDVIDLWANTSVSTGISSELQTQCDCP